MDTEVQQNRVAWEDASQKHVREYANHLQEARDGGSLLEREVDLLRPLLRSAPAVVHLQSGNGLDDIGLVAEGARFVAGVDYSQVAAGAAQRRADEVGSNVHYVVAEVPRTPLRDECADLVYTGKGAIIWMPSLTSWAQEVARLLKPSGQLFIYEAHPMVPVWSWDEDEPRVRPDRSYFARSHINDSFPARGAREWQWSLGEIVTAVVSAGLEILTVTEYAEPFWRPADVSAAAWDGRLPNAFALLARKPS
jgi:SAM-dependent methyltransferase